MTELDDLIHLTGYGIKVIHDSILESGSGLQGLKPGLSVEALVGRIHSNLFYQTFRSIEAVAALYAEVIAKGHVFNRLVPVDNSLIFINFMNRLRAKRTDSLTNRFFLLSIRPV